MDAAVQVIVQPSAGRDSDRALLEQFGTISRSCPDCSRDHGRPTVAEPGRWVSLSRAGGFVAVAFSTVGPVGVDLESEDAVSRHATDAFDPREHPDARTWTAKEAALKADGRGLRVDPRELLIVDGVIERWNDSPFDVETVHLAELAVSDDVVGSVVWSADSGLVEVSGGWATLFRRASDAAAGAHHAHAGLLTARR